LFRVNGRAATSGGLHERENTMRNWKMMMVGGAAMLISVGSARAVEQVDGATASAQRATSWEAKGGGPSDPARAKADLANGDASGFVTRDELEKDIRALIERLERERNARFPAPTFTDAG
jgi:hypothetical protein